MRPEAVLADQAIRRAHLSFRAAEESGEGVLSVEEIGTALRSQGLQVPCDLDAICRGVDLDKKGNVNLIEFVAATMEPRICHNARLCKTAFRVLDADLDGFITQPDLEKILVAAPGGSSDRAADAAAILASAGPDEHGRVDLARFCRVLLDDAAAAAALANSVLALDCSGDVER